MTGAMEGLDKHIEEQREQRAVLDRIAYPYSIAELQELAEKEDWEACEQ